MSPWPGFRRICRSGGPGDVERGHGIIATYAGEARADAAVATILAARARALDEPHWTLQYLGVRTTRRGEGLGRRAVAPGLEVCDGEGLPCALVSTDPRNVPFYQRLGFEVDSEVTTPDRAATLRAMHRRAPAR